MQTKDANQPIKPALPHLKIHSGLRAGCDCDDHCQKCGLWGKYWCEADCTRGGA